MPGFEHRTALHEAVIRNDLNVASMLLNADAKREVFDDKSKKPKYVNPTANCMLNVKNNI